MELNYEQIIKAIGQRKFAPVYWLEGEETYFIDDIADRIEETALQEEEKDFNQVILYGKEVDFKQVVDQARQFPMMAPNRVVILREAQDMQDIDSLLGYLRQPNPQTILVIQYKYKKIRKNTPLGKALKDQAVLFQAKPKYESELPQWVMNRGKIKKLNFRPEAATLFAELAGNHLSTIEKELDKIRVVVGRDDAEITVELVNQYIGQSREFNAFELNNALGKKDSAQAFRIVQYFSANPKSVFPPLVIGSLTSFFTRVWIAQENGSLKDQELATLLKMKNAYFIRDYRQAARNYPRQKLLQIFGLLEEYDLRIKGVNNRSFESGELFKELVFKILY
jgi:DNA polymerase-3 subunit delta